MTPLGSIADTLVMGRQDELGPLETEMILVDIGG